MKRLTRLTVVLTLAMGLIAGGCATTQKTDMTADDLVQEAKKNVCEITVSEAKQILDSGEYLFIDCREPKDYKMGHVHGAINIPRGLLEFKIATKVPEKNQHIVMYCKTGGRSCLSSCTLCRMGYTNVKSMGGGWMAWEKAGYPID